MASTWCRRRCGDAAELGLGGANQGKHALTMQTRKEALLRLGTDEAGADDRDLIATCSMSADFREGMQAFFKKRWPEGEGR